MTRPLGLPILPLYISIVDSQKKRLGDTFIYKPALLLGRTNAGSLLQTTVLPNSHKIVKGFFSGFILCLLGTNSGNIYLLIYQIVSKYGNLAIRLYGG